MLRLIKCVRKESEMEDKDLVRLKERLEEIFEHEVTVKQAKQVAVFVKLFVSMGADFGDLSFQDDIVYHETSTAQAIRPWKGVDFASKGSQTGGFTTDYCVSDGVKEMMDKIKDQNFIDLFIKSWSKNKE